MNERRNDEKQELSRVEALLGWVGAFEPTQGEPFGWLDRAMAVREARARRTRRVSTLMLGFATGAAGLMLWVGRGETRILPLSSAPSEQYAATASPSGLGAADAAIGEEPGSGSADASTEDVRPPLAAQSSVSAPPTMRAAAGSDDLMVLPRRRRRSAASGDVIPVASWSEQAVPHEVRGWMAPAVVVQPDPETGGWIVSEGVLDVSAQMESPTGPGGDWNAVGQPGSAGSGSLQPDPLPAGPARP